jgi:hypothetical protein
VDHLNGYVYHMVHFNNLENIFLRRAILSKEMVKKEAVGYQSIASEDVQSLRYRIFVWDFAKQRYRRLHSYVPFYFTGRAPMLHVQYRQGIQQEIVIFEVSRSILKDQGVLFTDGNASNQQLSKSGGEKVGIRPATISDGLCHREYRPGGRPLGTNASYSNFYADVIFLEHLNWGLINDQHTIEDIKERTRIKHAEVLVPDLLPLGRVLGISVNTRDMVQAVNGAISECGLAGRIPSAMYKPALFF